MTSPEIQERAIRDHCARLGYDVVEVMYDLDLSGRLWKRRQIERAIGMIEARQVDVIVVWKISRVARDPRRLDWNIAVDRVETAGGRFESATEPIDATTSSGRFARGILAELASFESERIGEGWNDAHQRRWRNGLPHSGRPRLGYTYDRATGYTIDEETAPFVRAMYAKIVAGETFASVARFAHDMKLDNMRTHRSVMDFLDSGFGAGWITHHDPECRLPHPKLADGRRAFCANRVRERGAHEAIIDEATWESYLAARELRRGMPARLRSPTTAFAGVIFCAACGWRYVKTSNDRRSYRCNRTDCPNPGTVNAQRIEDAVLQWLPRVAAEVNAAASKKPGGESTKRAERERLERIAVEAEKALTRLTIDHARGIVPEVAYAAARDELLAERNSAESAALKIRTADTDNRARAKMATDLLAAWGDLTEPERNGILREICVIHVYRRAVREIDILVYAANEAPELEKLARP